jgi:hypothetical protein
VIVCFAFDKTAVSIILHYLYRDFNDNSFVGE